MTPQEYEVLEIFLKQLTQPHSITKDLEADRLIARAFAEQTDAPYLVVQRALLLEQALNNAKTQIAELQQRQSSSSSGSFLNSNSWGRGEPDSRYAEPAPVITPSQQTPNSNFFNGRGGSFLGTMAATAAGVAGGAFLFQGIGSLLNHHNDGQNKEGVTENTTNNLLGEDTSNNLLADNSSDDSFDLGNSIDDDLSSF